MVVEMGMGFAPTWLRQVSPLLHVTTLTTGWGSPKVWGRWSPAPLLSDGTLLIRYKYASPE